MRLLSLLTLASILATATASRGAPARILVDASKPGHAIPPTLWGVFFEDINLSADGGIYPELVRNRSFEDGDKIEHWKLINRPGSHSQMAIDTSQPLNEQNPHSLRVIVDGETTLGNEGYWGMNIVKGDHYQLKLAARAKDGFRGPLTLVVENASGRDLAGGEIYGLTERWQWFTAEMVAKESDPKARLGLGMSGKGTVWLDMVSLMPKKTWKGHGLRVDLAESLAALKPSFLRFPGGCWVEGDDRAHMYNWKKTIGDPDQRTPLWNIWGYNATHGLGFHEYLQLGEDLGATPLWDINCGMSHKETVPMNEMDQWVQDALDSIEYANGPTTSKWGALRAKAGHPAPFNLRYMEIGNENGGGAYGERWPLFVKAIKEKYPDMQLIANHWQGGYPEAPMPDIVDEHYYNNPEFFMQQAHRYDKYDRNGPKIFVGEYAVTKATGKGSLRGAIGEAAFMTGIERNSDVVRMACYAPLLVNLNHRAWPVNLINFDSSRWYGIPSYYVQTLFSEHRGDVTLPISVEAGELPEPAPSGRIGVGTWNTAAEFKDIKVTAPDGKILFASDFTKNSAGWKLLGEGAGWSVQDGGLRQTAEREFIRALAGDKSWTDYTLELKARKISGREGFLILFHVGDDEDRVWWNLGGWRNTQHALELDGQLDPKRGSIETGRWYDIKIQVTGRRIQCWLDGKLMHDVQGTPNRVRGLYASATLDTKAGAVVVKVVNPSAIPTDTEVALPGLKGAAPTAQAIVLTSDKPTDENTLEEPLKVSPKTQTIRLSGTTLKHSFPGNSLTVLRIKTEN